MSGVWKVAAQSSNHEIDERVSIVGSGLEHSDDEGRKESSKTIETMSKRDPTSPIIPRDKQEANVECCIKEVMSHSEEVHGDKLSKGTIPEHKNGHEDSVDPVSYTHLTLPTIYSV